MSWVHSACAAAKAKCAEELLRVRLLRRYRADRAVATCMLDVMNLTPDQVDQKLTSTDPRSLPSSPEFLSSGWSEHMLLRYLLALDRCAGARVLDSCCGLGWGSHLVAAVSARVTGIDLDADTIAFCKSRWERSNLHFEVGSVLELPFERDSFDVVLCMDAIEHFSQADGARYLCELKRVCRPGGHLFGSSAFPETPGAAQRLLRKNPHHLRIYTRREMGELVRTCFGHPLMITRHYFQAARG